MAAASRFNLTRAGIGLVIGIIILALVVFGGIWLVRERGEQARRDEAIAIADQQIEQQDDQDIAIGSGNSTSNNSDQAAPSQSTDQAPASSNGAASTAAPAAAANELPQTGPELVQFVAFALLSFAVASYIQSRKLLLGR
jgi:FtsZ-interacting cell division protein ZipA